MRTLELFLGVSGYDEPVLHDVRVLVDQEDRDDANSYCVTIEMQREGTNNWQSFIGDYWASGLTEAEAEETADEVMKNLRRVEAKTDELKARFDDAVKAAEAAKIDQEGILEEYAELNIVDDYLN